MGMITGIMSSVFGGGRNVVAETVEVFRESAEKGASRDAALSQAALAQFAAEFAHPRRSAFDRAIDGLNRIPRPAMALGTLGLFVTAMVDPVWFASRMQGIALVPEPMWWLLGAIVGFYFGARHQAKGQDFQRSIAASVAQAGQVAERIAELRSREAPSVAQDPIEALAPPVPDAEEIDVTVRQDMPERSVSPAVPAGDFGDNAALAEWAANARE